MKPHLHKLHLHLLLALDALLTECHVTRAGKKLFISQSAMSNLLKQLRELLQDELLVRGANGKMILTTRAQALQTLVKEALEKAEKVFTVSQPFDPTIAKRTFTLGMSDYTEFVILPSLIKRITQAAPHVDIIIKHLNFITEQEVLKMEQDKIDVVVGTYTKIPACLESQKLFSDQPVCLGWKKNPLLKKPLTPKQYANAPHLLLLFAEHRSEAFSEQLLTQHGYQRRVVVTMSHIVTAIHALLDTPLITTVLKRVAEKLATDMDICIQPMPFDYPEVITTQVWHPKNNLALDHQWLRGLIKKAAGEIANTKSAELSEPAVVE